MGRVLGIDFGMKRTGIAVTDPLQLIASGLDTVPTGELMEFLKKYLLAEPVDTIVLGEPLHRDGEPTAVALKVYELKSQLEKHFPGTAVVLQDERGTSREASMVLVKSGVKKKKRQERALVDKVSAALILRDYMEQHVW
jgi:putative Holliday junction resolvase